MKAPRKKKQQRPYPGEIVAVQSRIGGHPLPSGLKDGDEVKLLKYKHGEWHVKKEDKIFVIDEINIRNVHRFKTCVAPPPKYEE